MDFTLKIVGDVPLIMHNARLSDPLDPATRALARVTSKRKKTEDDHMEAARLEWIGGLYFDDDLGPSIPSANIEATLFNGATKSKLGKALRSALIINDELNPLLYTGPRDIDTLWKDGGYSLRQSVKVGMSRVMRTRPCFHTWAVDASGSVDGDVIDRDAFESIVTTSGSLIGLGDWRPRYGRFSAEVEWK